METPTTSPDFSSASVAEQQRILQRFVTRMVHTNQTHLVDELLRRDVFHIDDIENLYRQSEETEEIDRVVNSINRDEPNVPAWLLVKLFDQRDEFKVEVDRGSTVLVEYRGALYRVHNTLDVTSLTIKSMDTLNEFETELQELIDSMVESLQDEIADAEEPQGIYEWWLVDSWFLNRLIQLGEPVLTNEFGGWWGRTTTGQSIILDYVVGEIFNDLPDYIQRQYRDDDDH